MKLSALTVAFVAAEIPLSSPTQQMADFRRHTNRFIRQYGGSASHWLNRVEISGHHLSLIFNQCGPITANQLPEFDINFKNKDPNLALYEMTYAIKTWAENYLSQCPRGRQRLQHYKRYSGRMDRWFKLLKAVTNLN